MEADLISRQHPLLRHRIQLGRFVLRQAAVFRIIAVGFNQRGRLRAERTIHEAFQHAGAKHVVRRGMGVALPIQLFDRIVERQPL